jgi:hypothetical protein
MVAQLKSVMMNPAVRSVTASSQMAASAKSGHITGVNANLEKIRETNITLLID